MKTINRSALVARPAQPFLDWCSKWHYAVDSFERGLFRDGQSVRPRALQFSRPLLPTMKNRNQFEPILLQTVRDDEGRVCNNKLASSRHSPWSAQFWVRSKKVHRRQNSLGYERRVLLGILGDELSERRQMSNGSTGPNDLHRGALVSPRFPQEPSHFSTLSWLTERPESRSAIPP